MRWPFGLPGARLTVALAVLVAVYLGIKETGWRPVAGETPAVETASAPPPPAAPDTAFDPAVGAAEGGRLIARFSDPAGDDRGPGGYTYPTDAGFAPGKGLFDLETFAVSEHGDEIFFDLTFGAVTNPWKAPEGFFHQRVDVFVDAEPGKGRTTLVEEGANVQFCAEHPWDVWLRGEPWGGSALLDADGRVLGDVAGGQVRAEVLPDGRTIRWRVARQALGKAPRPGWWYYVLVGGYDTFGPSRYRIVLSERSEWYFGGGARMPHPNVMDILAPARGPRSQKAQLGSYATARKAPATLYPVGDYFRGR